MISQQPIQYRYFTHFTQHLIISPFSQCSHFDSDLVLSHFSFLKGDMFIVHNELDDGWMWVTNVRTEEQGLIVEDLVEEVVSTRLEHINQNIKEIYLEKSLINGCTRTVNTVIGPSELVS